MERCMEICEKKGLLCVLPRPVHFELEPEAKLFQCKSNGPINDGTCYFKGHLKGIHFEKVLALFKTAFLFHKMYFDQKRTFYWPRFLETQTISHAF